MARLEVPAVEPSPEAPAASHGSGSQAGSQTDPETTARAAGDATRVETELTREKTEALRERARADQRRRIPRPTGW